MTFSAFKLYIFLSICVFPGNWTHNPLCRCHESCPCTPCYSPPEVTRSPHGLLHHTNGCTSPKTTFPITHCTDVTQLIALITQLIALITQLIALITLYISRGLPLCHRWVLYSVYPSDSYSTEPTQSFLPCLALPCLALPCLALPCLALPCLALPCLALPCLALPCLALIPARVPGLSLCLALLDIVRRSQTYACPRITLCLAIYIPVCQCVTHVCFQPCLLIKPCKWILMPPVS